MKQLTLSDDRKVTATAVDKQFNSFKCHRATQRLNAVLYSLVVDFNVLSYFPFELVRK